MNPPPAKPPRPVTSAATRNATPSPRETHQNTRAAPRAGSMPPVVTVISWTSSSRDGDLENSENDEKATAPERVARVPVGFVSPPEVFRRRRRSVLTRVVEGFGAARIEASEGDVKHADDHEGDPPDETAVVSGCSYQDCHASCDTPRPARQTRLCAHRGSYAAAACAVQSR